MLRDPQRFSRRIGKEHIPMVIGFIVLGIVAGFFLAPAKECQSDTRPPATAPGQVTRLEGVVSEEGVLLSWTAADPCGSVVLWHHVRYAADDGDAVTVGTGSSRTTFNLTGLAGGLTYEIAVAAENAIGIGAYSAPIDVFVPIIATVPSMPTNVVATPGDGQVQLSFDMPDDGGSPIISYMVGYKSQGEADYRYFDTRSSSTSVTVPSLENGVTYSFIVYGINAAGEGQPSHIVTASPVAPETLAISSGPDVQVSAGSATISWVTSIEAISEIRYGLSPGLGQTISVSSAGSETHTALLSGLWPCTIYSYKTVSVAGEASVESPLGEFVTSGCRGNAAVLAYRSEKATSASGANLETRLSGRGLIASVPPLSRLRT